jgi:hypothetical protein
MEFHTLLLQAVVAAVTVLSLLTTVVAAVRVVC